MHPPKRPGDKSYSEVMNEWAAQRHMVNADRSRLFHPPYDASPGAKFLGYLFRISLVTLVPAAIYLGLLKSWLKSEEFNTMISTGVAQTLEADKVETRGAAWKFDGILSMESIKATAGAGAFYSEMEGRKLGTRMSFPSLFRREWILPRVSIGELSIALRSGGLGKVPLFQLEDGGESLPAASPAAKEEAPKTGALGQPPSGLLRAGFGISPDFKSLAINEIHAAYLNVTWGTGPATSGALTGMQSNLTRSPDGWVISGNGGHFRQGWLDGMKVDSLSVKLGMEEAVIEQVAFSRTGGGKAIFAGRMTLGEVPVVDGQLQMDRIPLQELVPTPAAALFNALGKGTLKLSGSVNRTSGIRMEGELEVQSGRISALPVLKALNQLTNEDQFRLLALRSGRVRISSSGGELHGGLIVDLKEIELECGPLARLRGNIRYEQTLQGETPDGREGGERVVVTGLLRLGLSSVATARLKPAVVERFLKRDESGWSWLDIVVEGPLNNNLTKDLAFDMLKVSAATP